MSSPLQQRSPFIRLLDAFLQEENIKWVLGLGVGILLGSSLRLVTLHWVEYTPVWKYLILLSYTVAVFAFGELSYHRLGLRKTGTVLMSLTVLLIPLSFLALHWVQPRADVLIIDGLRNTGLSALLGMNLIWSALISRRIFQHFLRRTQPTFLVCYLILCVAGAVIPGLPHAWSPGLALFLWAVFAVGTVKVNRHVFWLTEEHRLPRIFGFFPILLLGTLFASVFALGLARQISPPWFGLLSTLISLPVLLTADAVAHVFEQRTGGLVRPIPWSISGPLVLGILLGATGVVMALAGWPANSAIVPTAVIASAAMAVVAYRTRKSAFVWGMVVCIIIAYQTSPVFVKELVLQIRDQAAAAVRESRLPYAFYGLTYAPLIAVFSVVSATLLRRGNRLFGLPLQITATSLSLLLLGVSFSHPSAVFPVSLILCPMFAGQAILFRQRPYLIPAAAAWLAAAFGTLEFAHRVWDWDVSPEGRLFVWTIGSAVLLAPGALFDRWTCTLRQPGENPVQSAGLDNVCQLFSLAGTMAAAGVWIGKSSTQVVLTDFGPVSIVALLISVLLASHALRWLKPGLGEMTLAFATYAAHLHLMHGHWIAISSVDSLCLMLLVQWGLSYLLKMIGTTRVARTFGPAAYRVSACGLSVLFGFFLLGWMAMHSISATFPWTMSLLMMAWALDASRRIENERFTKIVWCSLFVFVSAAFTGWVGPENATRWWMVVWTMTGLVLLCLRRLLIGACSAGRIQCADGSASEVSGWRQRFITWLTPVGVIVPILLFTIAIISLAFLGWPQRFAGLLALCGLAAMEQGKLRGGIMVIFGPLLNWQLLVASIAGWSGMTGLISELTAAEMEVCGLPLAAFAAMSALVFEARPLRRWVQYAELLAAHQVTLVLLTVGLLGGTIHWNAVSHWTSDHVAWAAAAWIALAGAAFMSSVRVQDPERVWLGEWVLSGSVIYFTAIGVLHWTSSEVMYGVMLAGLGQWMIGSWSAKSNDLKILSQPLQQVGFWLPLTVLPLAFLRFANASDASWAGTNSVPLLGAAAFYFWRGLERRHVGTTILSAVILNMACVLLWKDLGWSDPQLFLIPIGVSFLVLTELLSQEIPSQYHNRLRLVGSLVILVSPVFHIVTGSWAHILTLMVASAVLALVAIGLRVRTLLYTSTAFLLADLIALVARGSIDEPNVLWIAGVALGTSIIALGAVCENHRETVLARLRCLAAELEQWA